LGVAVRVEHGAAAREPAFDPTATTPFGPWRAVDWEVRPDERNDSDQAEVAQSAWTSAGAAPAGSGSRGVPGRLRGLGSRFGWGLADQAVSSLTNFAVSLYVARTLGAVQFGAFSLAYVTYSFILNASRGLATDPLTVRFSGVGTGAWKKAVSAATGTATAVGLLAAAGMLAAGLLLSGTARSAFIAMGLTMPGLMLQDAWRYAFFAHGQGARAFLNDLIWAAAMAPALITLRLTGHETIFWFVLAWGAAATIAAAAGPLQARVIPRIHHTRTWITTHKDLAIRYLAENTIFSGSAQLRLTFIGIIAGLAAVGYVQAAQLVMGPFVAALMGISLVTVPEAARVLRHSPRHLRLFCVLVAGVLAGAGAVWGVAAHFALPLGLGQFALKSLWRPTNLLVLPVTVAVMGTCATVGASAGLRALGSSRRSLRAMIISSTVTLVASVLGALQGGAVGTVRGTALAGAVAVVVWWWQLRAALRESPAITGARADRAAGRHRAPESPARSRRDPRQEVQPEPRDDALPAPRQSNWSAPSEDDRPAPSQKNWSAPRQNDRPVPHEGDRPASYQDSRSVPREGDRPASHQNRQPAAGGDVRPAFYEDSRSAPRDDGRTVPREGARPAFYENSRPAPREGDRPAPYQGSRLEPRQGDRPASYQGGRLEPRQGDRPAPHEAGGPSSYRDGRSGPGEGDRPARREGDRPASYQDGRPAPRDGDRPAPREDSRSGPREASRPASYRQARFVPRAGDRPASREGDRPASHQNSQPAPREAGRPVSDQDSRSGPREADRSVPREAGRPARYEHGRSGPREAGGPAPYQDSRPGPQENDRPAPQLDGRPAPSEDGQPAPSEDGGPAPSPRQDDEPHQARQLWSSEWRS